MWLWVLLAACRPSPEGLTLRTSDDAASVVVATFRAPAGPAQVVVTDVDGEEHVFQAVRRGERAEAALVGLPAGEPFTAVPMSDGVAGDATEGWGPTLPEGVPQFVVSQGDDPPDTRFLVTLTDAVGSVVGVVDAQGRWRWWWEAPPDRTFSSPRPTADGFLWSSQDRERADVDQLAVVRSFDGTVAQDVALTGAHHMVAELDGGELAWLAWDTRVVPWDGAPARVTADRVLVGRGDGDERELLSWFDDLGPAEVPCGHGLDPILRQGEPTYEWSHANSLVWEPETDTLVANARLTDTLIALDRATGDVRWQLGGPGATVAFERPGDAFSHAHLSDVAPDRVLVFDNGVHHPERRSRVVDYTIDTVAGTATVTDVLELGVFVSFLGDARWRDDGGWLVATSTPGSLTTWGADHTRRWSLRVDGDAVLGRVRELRSFP
jgi:hypothetical protein